MIEKITQTVDSLYPNIMNTVEFLSTVDRGSKCLPGLAKTAGYLEGKLKAAGCEVTLHPNDEYGATVVGRKKGRGKAKILFYAHMDTVWPDGTCAQWPYRVDEEFAYGPGVSDCTHGLIASLYMLQALDEIGFEDYGELIVLFNPDEEITSPSSTKWLQQYAREADIAFCMEGADATDEFVTCRAGSAYYHVRVTGQLAHCGVNPEEGADANIELVHFLNEVEKLNLDDTYYCLCWIKGGVGDCTVSDNAYAMLRFRIGQPQTTEVITKALNELAAKRFRKGTTLEVEYWPGGGFQPMPRLPWADDLCKLIEDTSAEMGNPLHEAYSGGGDDAASSVLLVPTVDGMGPTTQGCHTRGEKLILADIVPRISLITELVTRISADPKFLRKNWSKIYPEDSIRP